jgi:hypothetical protein
VSVPYLDVGHGEVDVGLVGEHEADGEEERHREDLLLQHLHVHLVLREASTMRTRRDRRKKGVRK